MESFRRKGILLLVLFFISSMPYNPRTEYFYNLTKLKEARPPERIKLVMVDNIGSGKPLIEEGLLFTFKDRKASSVGIAGNFSSWNIKYMTRGKDGVWFFFLPNSSFSGKIVYKFNVDGLWTEDPWNGLREDDKQGSYTSLAEIDAPEEGKLVTYKILKGNNVLFRLYRPEARIVSLVGDFNGWNPENDLMKKDKKGIWRLEKKLAPGTYRYKFIVDGQWMPDTFNPDSGTDNTGEICSILKLR
ncbi:MAG TPA: glycogen-binding domain-containing protein [Spirochaetota bacterium]|jgi:1,4-alpha-glucan branching enzyme|nr:MAG: glycogen branching enzyme [Spirochaetes bacterium ADurb.Bin218]HOK02395.1 glycogen-binding domain-containing protein [Spirochaetota bacterium]HOK93017.1 glycogen-binding domain-containing protein [Spirochaetota bacterium]HON16264.1 glycogen-binding domain-containing protein [Spirochaetota bacterium]HPD78223.1 glycogen-binding domain-containing protein [Spirochaetota bacterium]